MKKKSTLTSLFLQQNILTLLLLTFVVIGIWVGFSIYFSYSKTTIGTTDAGLIAPLNPKLDSTLFTKLAARKTWTDQELSSFTPSAVVISNTQAITPPPVAKILASPNASGSASISATTR